MDEYIKRESLIEHIHQFAPEFHNDLVYLLISKEPAADVRPERHGHWIAKEFGDEYYTYTNYFCSECGRKLIGYLHLSDVPYCHCGAKMDGEENNG